MVAQSRPLVVEAAALLRPLASSRRHGTLLVHVLDLLAGVTSNLGWLEESASAITEGIAVAQNLGAPLTGRRLQLVQTDFELGRLEEALALARIVEVATIRQPCREMYLRVLFLTMDILEAMGREAELRRYVGKLLAFSGGRDPREGLEDVSLILQLEARMAMIMVHGGGLKDAEMVLQGHFRIFASMLACWSTCRCPRPSAT